MPLRKSFYIKREQDLRGDVSSEKGWAHGIAHVADALGIFSLNSYLNDLDLIRLLTAIATKFPHPVSSVYLHSEEEKKVHDDEGEKMIVLDWRIKSLGFTSFRLGFKQVPLQSDHG